MPDEKTEIENLRKEFYNTPLPDFSSEEWFNKMYEEYTNEIHPYIQEIRLQHALSLATAHTRVRR